METLTVNVQSPFSETVTKTSPSSLGVTFPGLNTLFGAAPKPTASPTQEVVMNKTAQVFRDLLSRWQHDAASPQIDTFAAELVAQVAKNGSTCVGLMQTSSIPKLFGLIYFLDGYGLLLRQRYRDQRDGIFVYLDRKQEVMSEFAGSVVSERSSVQEPVWPEFARAA
jgi:hypothetical protein